MEDGKEFESDRQRAEVFDALGHPTRIAILKALSEGPLGFAELKRKTEIESSGHLSHHLTKLGILIKTDDYGKYCLSDYGKDALLTVQTVEKVASGTCNFVTNRLHLKFGIGLKAVSLVLVVLLVAVSVVAVVEYNQAATLQNHIDHFSASDYFAFYDEFGLIPQTNVNSSWNPPVSMLDAAHVGLEAEGYNRTSLINRRVSANLFHLEWDAKNQSHLGSYDARNLKINGTVAGGVGIVTSPPLDYLPITDGNVVTSYAWLISVSVGGFNLMNNMMLSVNYVDAVTGELIIWP
jgi:DNA-binding transcriptional ArsR family regulator